MRVTHSLVYVGTEVVLKKDTKKKAGRLVVLSPIAVAALKKQWARIAADKLAVGPAYLDGDFVFAKRDGSNVKPNTVSKTLLRWQGDVPRLTLHGLRHTFATLGLLAGVPTKVMSEVLGHSSTAVTNEVYIHVIPGQKADAMNVVSDLIAGAPRSATGTSPSGS